MRDRSERIRGLAVPDAPVLHDPMGEIHERRVKARGVATRAPTDGHPSPGSLEPPIDRLACADGGTPDPTRTHGETAAEAEAIEGKGRDCQARGGRGDHASKARKNAGSTRRGGFLSAEAAYRYQQPGSAVAPWRDRR